MHLFAPAACSRYFLSLRTGTRFHLFSLLAAIFLLLSGSFTLLMADPGPQREITSDLTSLSKLSENANPDQIRFDPRIEFVQTGTADPVIDTIIVIGNTMTERFVILAEMELGVGDIASADLMRTDANRLESIGLFSRASLKIGTMPYDRTALIVEVTELWYIWPGIYFAIDDQDPSRTSIGLIVSHENFRGRNEFLSISGRVGYISGGEIEWDIPYLSRRNPNWSLGMDLKYLDEQEPRFIKEREGVVSRNRAFEVRVGYRFNLQNSAWVDARVQSREFDSDGEVADWLVESTTGRDILSTVVIGAQRDTRAYRAWPDNAYVAKVSLATGFGLNHSTTSYVQPSLQLAGYVTPVERAHFASRIRTSTFVGGVPSYERLLLDDQNGIRTPMNKQFEGSWRFLTSLEARYDLFPISYLTFNLWKPMDPYTKNLKFGISTTVFTDFGMVGGIDEPSPYSDSPETDGYDMAYGIGLVFHVPYRDLIRLEVMRSAMYPSDGIAFRVQLGTFL